jgi:arsenate reductase-like glutaredoxin family protein
MASSLREQWTTLIKNKISEKIAKITQTPEYKQAFKNAEQAFFEKAGVQYVLAEIKKGEARVEDLEKLVSKQREENSKLIKLRDEQLKQFPEYHNSPNQWRSYNYSERISMAITPAIINDPEFPFGSDLDSYQKVLSTLDTQFLIATTPKQLKEAAQSILDKLGWTIDSLQ